MSTRPIRALTRLRPEVIVPQRQLQRARLAAGIAVALVLAAGALDALMRGA